MCLYQPQPSIQCCLNAFEYLISLASETVQARQPVANISKFRGEMQIYSDAEARIALEKLFEKNKTNFQKKNWKIEQTNLLCFIVRKYQTAHGIINEPLDQLDWEKISQCIPYREPSACRFRYLSLTSPNISQQPWSTSESQMLFRLVQSLKEDSINWKKISEKLYDCGQDKIYRTGKQCREHYTCFLRPNLKKGQWTSDQDYNLICLFLKYGKKWSKMTKLIEGRNQNSIKNRFFLIFQNKLKTKLSQSDLVKLVKRKKEKLEKTIKSTVSGSLKQETSSFVEILTQQVEQSPNYNIQFQQNQPQNSSELLAASEKSQLQQSKIEGEQKCELDFTEDFQKYIDL